MTQGGETSNKSKIILETMETQNKVHLRPSTIMFDPGGKNIESFTRKNRTTCGEGMGVPLSSTVALKT